MSTPDPKFQVRGHVSQETALLVKNYMLNGIMTDVRYWVETSPTYGQRVIRQMFHTNKGDWFNPKPYTKYAPIVVMFHDYSPLNVERDTFNGTNRFEPVDIQLYVLSPEFIRDDRIDEFLNYYSFDEYQRRIILAYKERRLNPNGQASADAMHARAQVVSKPVREVNPLLEEKRRLAAELLALKVEAQRLKNAQLAAKTLAPVIVSEEERLEKDRAALVDHFSKTGRGFTSTQLDKLRDIAYESAHNLPGKVQPWHLDLHNPIKLAELASQRKIHFLDEHAERVSALADNPEAQARVIATFERTLKASHFRYEQEDATRNAEWFETETARRAKGLPAKVIAPLNTDELISKLQEPYDPLQP